MGQKDLQQGEYFDSNIRFADVYNGILFGGNTVIKPEELEECDSVLIQVLENYTIKGKKLASGNEFLSGMKKEWKLLPVVPLVLYMGKDECWDGAISLYDLLDIDDDLKPYVNNYKINLYDYHRESDFSKFKTENRLMFELLYHNDNPEKVEQIFKEAHDGFELDKNASKTLLKLADIKIDVEDIKVVVDGKEKYDVCKAVEIMKANAREEGIEQGTILVLHDLAMQGIISVEIAANKASMSVEEFLTNVKKYMN